jgi:citrate lyase subunit beta/citryl-CoA lyase
MSDGTRRGTAGRKDGSGRFDMWVEIELREEGGIEIDSDGSIREQISSVLKALGIEDARVAAVDGGALPFTIAARLEAAALRAGLEPAGDARPERTAPSREPSSKNRLRRSRLYVPGNEPKYLMSAGRHRADGVILDLEDSVHADEKDAARLLVRNALRSVDFEGAERMVRINRLPLGLADLEAILPERPDLILVSKVESAGQIEEVDGAIGRLLPDSGKDGAPWLMPILESARGIERCYAIAMASDRIAAMTIGLEDYAADIGVVRSASGEEAAWARQRLVNGATAAGVQAIDSVYGQVDDLDGLRRWCEGARRIGFQGMGCLHPRQIAVIHEAFNPTAAEIEKALEIVAAFETAQAAGLGVVSLGSKMIDPPVVKQAQRLVEQARELGLIGG